MPSIEAKVFKDQLVGTLSDITQHHTQGLLLTEEVNIKNFLLGVLKAKDMVISPKCKEFWKDQSTETRARLDHDDSDLTFRASVTKKIRETVQLLIRVQLKESQKEKIFEEIENDIKKCLTAIIQSRKKRLEEKKKQKQQKEAAQALTQSAMNVHIVDEKMVEMPPDRSEKPKETEKNRQRSKKGDKPRYHSGRNRSRAIGTR